MDINNIYKIGVDRECSSFKELEEHHVVSQGWSATGDLSFAFGDEEEFSLISANLDIIGSGDTKISYTLHRLLIDIKPGDIILAFEGNTLKGITQIPKKFIYFYNENVKEYKNSLFPVNWVKWSDFCKNKYLKRQGGQGVGGIEYSGLEEINKYCIDKWNDYISSHNINLQPPECEDAYAEIKDKFEVKKRNSKISFKKMIKDIKHKNMISPYINLLESNKNIILTGAPGTGKTYLAKQIAAQMILGKEYNEKAASDNEKKNMKEQCGFVQFHPSYDYTDFVEGLRPIKDDDGHIGFERQDGIFKLFCKRAINNLSDNNMIEQFDSIWVRLIKDVQDELLKGKLTKIGSFDYGLSSKNSLKYISKGTQSGYTFTTTKENVLSAYMGNKARPSGGLQKYINEVVSYMQEKYGLPSFKERNNISEKKKYVFVIDEINRGEISKIFGELFFSIDPGYRGTDGKVKTQYQNLVEEDDIFFDGFYVPENVYIIGTMNDIDRSVESMDFAFRRRFAFKEITAEDSQQMFDSEPALSEKVDEIIGRMNALNEAICPKDKNNSDKKGIDGLSSAYHIGASYFLKLANYKNEDGSFDYNQLWDNHLKGLLAEYLRGMPDAKDKLDALGEAFGIKKSDSTQS